jgi:ABC-type nitrate/sulfonate/bicarbonate transport system permease component
MKYLANYFLPISAFIAVILLWQICVSFFSIEKWLLPAPTDIVQALWTSRDIIAFHTLQTIFETVCGLGVAILLGVFMAIVMESSNFFRNLLKPLVVISQTIPFIVLAPLLIIWLGYGILPKIVVIVLACFFPIVINMLDGFGSVDTGMIKLLRSMGAGKQQMFRLVKLPASMPYFFSGLRIAGAYAVGIAVVSEWLGAENGLGIMLLRSAKSYETENVFATILVISVLSLVLVGIIELIARRYIRWFYLQKGKTD